MSASREMPKYECHKRVWALKIAGIIGDQHGMVYFQPQEPGYDKVPLSPEYVAKHAPKVGGYYVVYEDGYKSFSPESVFERGYTPMQNARTALGVIEDAEETLHNKRLIAAAPYLLNALQMLYEETVDYIMKNNLGGMDNQCMQMARNALAMCSLNWRT